MLPGAMPEDPLSGPLLRLLPAPQETVPLEGAYLAEGLCEALPSGGRPWVYTNFITSLDGRIALVDPASRRAAVPPAITNPRDWRLFQELAAQADVVVSTGRHVRELAAGHAQDILPIGRGFDDLRRWRTERGLPPEPAAAILSQTLDLPDELETLARERTVYVVTGEAVSADARRALNRRGVEVLTAGDGDGAEGRALIDALAGRGHRLIYSIAGPRAMHTLLEAGVLDRLYLTLAHRLLGGTAYDTLVTGPPLADAPGLTLTQLYLDAHAPAGAGQSFARFDRRDR